MLFSSVSSALGEEQLVLFLILIWAPLLVFFRHDIRHKRNHVAENTVSISQRNTVVSKEANVFQNELSLMFSCRSHSISFNVLACSQPYVWLDINLFSLLIQSSP